MLDLDAPLGSVLLEDYVDGFDNLLIRIGLAMNDDFVLQNFARSYFHHMFFGKAVVPSREIIRVFLKVLANWAQVWTSRWPFESAESA